MTQSSGSAGGAGCAGCLALSLLLALVVAAVMSVAAIVDPFGWMPPVGEVWADCKGSEDECSLERRYPGFWVHVLVNLAWALVAVLLTLWAFSTAVDLRDARAARFDGEEALQRFRAMRDQFVGVVATTSAVAASPIVVAVL